MNIRALNALPLISDLFSDHTHQRQRQQAEIDNSRSSIQIQIENNTANTRIEIIHNPKQRQFSFLYAISQQLLLLVLLASIASYAKANESYLANKESVDWVKLAALVEDERLPALGLNTTKTQKSSWALALDNDIFAPGHRDQDYTYGLNLSYSGANARDIDFSLKSPLNAVDELLGLANLPGTKADSYSLEAGLFGFTPKNIKVSTINHDDRPYASLVYFSSSHEQLDPTNNLAWKTTLTLGALGLNVVGELQNLFHEQIGGNKARGWDHQVSDGGELTARYVIARQHYLEAISDSFEVKSTIQGSVGYLTEASWSLSLRSGKILSPWSSFNPELISYGEKSTYANSPTPTNEHYFWAGFTLKARAYNAFLQGQFRDSEVSYSHNELHPLVLEGWAGYTYAIKQGYRFSYVLRGQTSEIKHGEGDRNVLWGGLILAKML